MRTGGGREAEGFGGRKEATLKGVPVWAVTGVRVESAVCVDEAIAAE